MGWLGRGSCGWFGLLGLSRILEELSGRRLVKPAGDCQRLALEDVVFYKLGDLLVRVLTQLDIRAGAGGQQQQFDAAPRNPIAAAKLGGVQLARSDVAVDRLSIHLKVIGSLVRRQDLSCS